MYFSWQTIFRSWHRT
ncbi:hypothetical protein D047_2850A, partial [Vibrio parahaemolyticus VPTS-2010_2]